MFLMLSTYHWSVYIRTLLKGGLNSWKNVGDSLRNQPSLLFNTVRNQLPTVCSLLTFCCIINFNT